MQIIVGIGSTTHLDRHKERMAKSALDGMTKQIKEKYIPQLIEHDWNKHIGVLLYGEVFQLKDGEYALGIVTGLFENNEEKEEYKSGRPNIVWKNYEKYLDINELRNLSGGKAPDSVSKNGTQMNIADLLEVHLDSTQVLPDGRVYKIKRFIAATGDLKIVVYPKDHNPSHFHVISKQRGIDARFHINTLKLTSIKDGKIKENDVKKIQDFFKTSPALLDKLRYEHKRLQ